MPLEEFDTKPLATITFVNELGQLELWFKFINIDSVEVWLQYDYDKGVVTRTANELEVESLNRRVVTQRQREVNMRTIVKSGMERFRRGLKIKD